MTWCTGGRPKGTARLTLPRAGRMLYNSLLRLCPSSTTALINDVPNAHTLVPRARHDAAPVGAPADRRHIISMPLQRRDALPRLGVPHAHTLVVRARHDAAPVGLNSTAFT